MAMLWIRREGGRCYSREHCPVLDSALPGENLPWWWFRFKEPPNSCYIKFIGCYRRTELTARIPNLALASVSVPLAVVRLPRVRAACMFPFTYFLSLYVLFPPFSPPQWR